MEGRPPTSVLLPTVTWTDACEEVASQLGPRDELLVVHDTDADPVADREGMLPNDVRLVDAGEPEGCSGKANAVAAGMEAASNDRIVWTDDDFHHPPDWLDGLHEAYEEHGPVSEVPVFVGRDPLAVALEPLYAVGGTLGAYAGNQAWAGAVTFERSDLDEAALRRDLRRSVSDDGVLSEHLDVTTLRRPRRVPVGGSMRETLERHVRFSKIIYRHDPSGTVGSIVALLAVLAACVLVPLYSAVALTLFVGAVYAAFGIYRPTALLAYPTAFLSVPLGAYAHVRRTFVWGGRRYRWPRRYEVEVVE